MKIRLAVDNIQKDSVVWCQGCIHNCPGCHNPETHSFQAGITVDVEVIKEKIKELEGQDGITFSGGDPMEQPEACAEISKYCKELGLNVWCYTGYRFEELLEKAKCLPAIKDFLDNIDVLVDGKFILSEKSYDSVFRGSKNQRLIDVNESLKKDKIIEVKKYSNICTNEKKENKIKLYI